MNTKHQLQSAVQIAFLEIFHIQIPEVIFQETNRDFEGDLTILIFPLLKFVKKKPKEIGDEIGAYLKKNEAIIRDFNVVNGFLNLCFHSDFFVNTFYAIYNTENFGITIPLDSEKSVMVEYSSPNTNKPLHLGHIRNNLLGLSISRIIEASGRKVYKTQIINDRGIHICKSMLTWEKFGKKETPGSKRIKGDQFVGHYYVIFDKIYKEQVKELISLGKPEHEAKNTAPILLEAQKMLKKWEKGDQKTIDLWKMMNQWVYSGFNETYEALGVDFDKNYYESQTYLLGKIYIDKGLESGIFFKKKDNSVWIDLRDEGLDEKLLLRSDGTSVYMTQDLGTAVSRFEEFDMDNLIYIVGDEQDYHFKVLLSILKKFNFPWADNLYHLSYGMVNLPDGKMKSREGKVVDADELIKEMEDTARKISDQLGKLEGYEDEEKKKLYKMIGMGALKYFILKVDPQKKILFDPEKSVDFNGNTGPFIQYTYTRIQSLLKKATFHYDARQKVQISKEASNLIKILMRYPETVQQSAKNYNPSLIANYIYSLVKAYNSFYQNTPILMGPNLDEKIFKIQLSEQVGKVIKSGFRLLGIDMPERM